MRGKAWAVGVYLGLLALCLAACHLTGSSASPPVRLQSITVTPASPSTARGVQTALTAVGTFSDGSSQDISAQAGWTSATPAVAMIGSPGRAVGMSAGSAVITAQLDGVAGSTTLTVTSATLEIITVAAGSVRLPSGLREPLTAVGTFSDGSSQDVTSAASWTTSDAGVVSISPAGEAAASTVGPAVITAQVGGVSGEVALFVTPATVESMTVTAAQSSLIDGLTDQLTATATYSDGSSRDVSSEAAWASSGIAASVAAGGLVTGVGVGSVSISATFAGVGGSTSLTVTGAALQRIVVTPATRSIANGLSVQFTATGTYSNGASQDISNVVRWSSSATAVATVMPGGLATAGAVGSAQLTATLGALSGSAPLTVTPAVLQSITVTPASPAVVLGQSLSLTATGIYSDGSSQPVSGLAWTSGQITVATVSASGLVTPLSAGEARITAASGTVSGSAIVTVKPAVLQAIILRPAGAAIAKGLTQQLTATGVYSDGSSQPLSGLSWTSASTPVATVNASGLVTAVNPGSAQITATAGGVSGSTGVTVTAAVLEGISVGPASLSVASGLTRQLTATGIYSDGTAQPVSGVSWLSGATSVATVAASGLVTAVAPGAVQITAVAGTIAGSTTLVVTPAVLQSIAIAPASPAVANGLTRQLSVTGIYSDGTSEPVTGASWSSAATAVATVSANGLVTALRPGTAPISASFGAFTASTTLTVTAAVLESITVLPGGASIANGLTQQFEAVGAYSDGSTQPLAGASWSSGASPVAVVDSDGQATARSPGSAQITATWGAVSGSTTLNVTPAVLQSMTVTPADPPLAKGLTQQLTAIGHYSDGSTQPAGALTWSSGTTTVATVGAHGLVSALSPGTAVITATAGAVTATTTVTVTAAVLEGISITPDDLSIASGLSQQLAARGLYSDGSTQPVSGVTWSSGATSVATVSDSGLALALLPGSALITATAAGLSGSITLTVVPAVLQSISVTPANAELNIGAAQQMTAIAHYSNGLSQPLGSVSWSSETPAVGSIDSAGLVEAEAIGSTRITATSGAVSGSTTLIISNALTGSGVLVPPGDGKHNYKFVTIDASAFTAGGTITMVIVLGHGVSSASYDLFDNSFTPVTTGPPVDSLAHAYDVPPGTTTTLTYTFGAGSSNVFKLGFEGNWFSPVGSSNTFTYNISITPP